MRNIAKQKQIRMLEETPRKETLIYSAIKKRARNIGLNITQLCRIADVDRSVLARLKDRVPKSVKTLYQIEAVLKEKEAEFAANSKEKKVNSGVNV